jgi:monovalent cation:H+ antiporter-2, CPA2 family
LLPALAGSAEGDPSEFAARIVGDGVGVRLALTLAKVAVFVALVLVVGPRLVPWLLEQAARTGSRELFTLSVLAAALGIAYGSAELFGVSFALGAFFAGVVLSESDLSHQAAADSLPLRDAFAVLFFVSVGMLFDPMILVREPFRIMAVLVVIVIAKSLPAIAIVMAFRHPVGSALTVSAGLAQIGEFSFILAGLGVGLGLLPPEGRDLILAGALLSITLNPLVFIAADRSAAWLGARPGLLARLEQPGDPPAGAKLGREPGEMAGPRHHRRVRPRRRSDRRGSRAAGPAPCRRRARPAARRGAPRARPGGDLGRCRGARRARGGAHRTRPPPGDRRARCVSGKAHP